MLNHFLSRINLFLTFLSPHLSLDLFLWLTRHFFSLVQSFHFGFLLSLPSCSSTCIIVTTIKQHISINYFLLYIFYIRVLYLVGYCIAPLLLKWFMDLFFAILSFFHFPPLCERSLTLWLLVVTATKMVLYNYIW